MIHKCLVVAVLLLVSGPGADDPAKKDLKFFEGSWTLAALEVNGKDVPAQNLEGTVLTIKGSDYKVALKNKTVIACVIKLNPTKSPKEIDMTFTDGPNKDKVHKGIYRFDGAKFQLARGLNPEQARPNQFATWPDTNYFVATWKRLDK